MATYREFRAWRGVLICSAFRGVNRGMPWDSSVDCDIAPRRTNIALPPAGSSVPSSPPMRVLPMMLLVAACGSPGGMNTDANGDQDSAGSGSHDAPGGGGGRTVFVIPMENKPSSQIYGNMMYAPYINGLFSMAAR